MCLRGPPDERSPAELLSFGVVNLDKPPGPSAHQVAAWVRDVADGALAGTESGGSVTRAAHAGTLDPKVTGCLPVLLGDAARAAQVFDDADKEYVTILELQERAPADFADVVAEFEGEIYQLPPKKSAVKRELRTRTVQEITVLERQDRRALFAIHCEAGTYVRKLCHHIGLALGTGAQMGELRRTATSTFDDGALATLHDLIDAVALWEDGDDGPLRDVVQPAERALEGIPQVTIAPSAGEQVAEGAPVYAPGVIDVEDGVAIGDLVVCVTPDGAAVCLGTLVGDRDAAEGPVVDLERVLV